MSGSFAPFPVLIRGEGVTPLYLEMGRRSICFLNFTLSFFPVMSVLTYVFEGL